MYYEVTLKLIELFKSYPFFAAIVTTLLIGLMIYLANLERKKW